MRVVWVNLALVLLMLQIGSMASPGVVHAQGSIDSGETLTGTIFPVMDSDAWTFSAVMGDRIIVQVGQITESGNFAPHVTIYSPGMVPLGNWAGALAAEVVIAAPSTGTFTAVVDDAGMSATGTYRITLAKTGGAVVVSAGDQGGQLTNGAQQIGMIDVGDLDVWTVTAGAGEAIVVRMGETVTNSTLSPSVRIYNPTGASVGGIIGGYSGPGAQEASTRAVDPGTYLVVVGDQSNPLGGTGEYRLTLAHTGEAVVVTAGDDGGELTNGALQIGMIDVGDLDVWTVTAGAGDAIVVRMGETVSNSTLSPSVRIYNPAGAQVGGHAGGFTGPGAEEASATAVAPGTYLVVVGDQTNTLSGAGQYRLTLAQTGPAVVVSALDEGGPLGGLSSGFISVGDLDVWTLSAIQGQTIHVTVEEAIAGSTLVPYLRLYRSNGALLASAGGASLAQVSVPAPTTGTYLVVIGDGDNGLGGSGPYWLAPAATTGVSGTPPTELALSRGIPSPFATRTVFRYVVPQKGEASLRVYDAQGRLVRTLVDERDKAAGHFEAAWDGRDDAGFELGPGLYLARLDSGGRRQTQKVILTR